MGVGLIFAKICLRSGLNVFVFHDYPSLIRGGHNISQVRVEESEINSHIEGCDLLVALNQETVDKHIHEITEYGGVVYDGSSTKINNKNNTVLYDVPLMQLARDIGKDRIYRNTIALGASLAVVCLDFNLLEVIIKEQFATKGENVIKLNIQCARAGYDYIINNYKNEFRNKLVKKQSNSKILVSGNEAVALGAIKASCKFHAQYPMTPSSQILHYLIKKADEYNMVVLQPEDEISVINIAIGASWVGARSMVATATGGFCLMIESFGLASMLEIPLVIVVGQRGGPATGLPTKNEQADLRFVMHASQGDFPRIVLMPGDIEDCFYFTFNAFNIADKIQNPVIVLHDQFLAGSSKSVFLSMDNLKIDRGLISNGDLNSDFKRYSFNVENGIGLRSLPGQKNGTYEAGGDEHDEHGQISEDPENRIKMMQKRMKKLDYAKTLIGGVNIYGNENADLTIVGWGSTKGIILDAMKFLEHSGIKTKFLQIFCASPFPKEKVTEILKSSKKVVLFEQNYSAQLKGLIMEYTGYEIKNYWVKYNGIPFSPSEILEKARYSFFNYT